METALAHDIESKERTEDVYIDESITFNNMLLPEIILAGLAANNFKKPSPIQLAAIPRARLGLDLIVQAKSGTGKTLVFTITALESIDVKMKRPQVIVLTPTREISFQVADVIASVGKFMKGLKVAVCIGGRPLTEDKPRVQGAQVVVGCPGRVRHLIDEKLLNSEAVRLLVLDEADKLLADSEGFQKDICYIFNKSCEEKQMLALSATYTTDLLEFTQRFMRSGQHVTPAGSPTPVLLGVRQFILITQDHPDYNARLAFKEQQLFSLLEKVSFDICCVFHHYSSRAESMNNILLKKGFASVCLTGKQTMAEREEGLKSLRSGKCRVLVTSDIAARGIDCQGINLIVNMGLPWSPASYLHRMGRAGRYGSHGVCISLISDGEELKRFRKLLGQIGGKGMAVNLIPTTTKFDVWNDDLDEYDEICGLMSDGESEEPAHSSEKTLKRVPNDNEKAANNSDSNGNEQKPSKLKEMTTISLDELQKELDRFLEDEKKHKVEGIKKKEEKKTPMKKMNPTYSQILSGYKMCDVSKQTMSDSNSSIEIIESAIEPTRKKVTPKKFVGLSPGVDLDESRKRKRGFYYSSTSSEFESGSYDIYSYFSDETMYTVEDSKSGVDLNVEHDDFESLSDISCECCTDDRPTGERRRECRPHCSHHPHPPHACHPHHPHHPHLPRQTDWYSVLNQQIHSYVLQARRAREGVLSM